MQPPAASAFPGSYSIPDTDPEFIERLWAKVRRVNMSQGGLPNRGQDGILRRCDPDIQNTEADEELNEDGYEDEYDEEYEYEDEYDEGYDEEYDDEHDDEYDDEYEYQYGDMVSQQDAVTSISLNLSSGPAGYSSTPRRT
jgi:hypothetical protein